LTPTTLGLQCERRLRAGSICKSSRREGVIWAKDDELCLVGELLPD